MQLFSAENLFKIVAGSQRVTSCERTVLCVENNATIIGKFNSFFSNFNPMFLKKVIVANCQSLIREVFTTSRVYGKPDVGIQATTNRAPMSTFLNKTGTQPSHCTLTHSGHKYKPNEPSDCARWPLSQMTRCGNKPNEPSDCAQWPLSQMTCCGHKRNEPSICTWWRFRKLKCRMDSTVVLLRVAD